MDCRDWRPDIMRQKKNTGKPYEGELHVRFDEGRVRKFLPTLSVFDLADFDQNPESFVKVDKGGLSLFFSHRPNKPYYNRNGIFPRHRYQNGRQQPNLATCG